MEENAFDKWLENCPARNSEPKNSVKQNNLGKDNLMSIQVPVTQNFSINGTEFSITTTDSILTNSHKTEIKEPANCPENITIHTGKFTILIIVTTYTIHKTCLVITHDTLHI